MPQANRSRKHQIWIALTSTCVLTVTLNSTVIRELLSYSNDAYLQNCRWKNTGSGEAWKTHTGAVDANKWKQITGSSSVPGKQTTLNIK